MQGGRRAILKGEVKCDMQTKRPLSPDLRANITRLKQMFGSSTDLYTKPVRVLGVDCCLCMFEGLSTLERLWVVMLAMLTESNYRPKSGDDLFQYIQHKTDLPLENTPVEDFDALRVQLTAGTTVILIDGCCKAAVLSTQNMQFRSVQEPSGEGNIRGSREGFTDLLRINLSLVRRLVRTTDLTVQILTAGERTKTEVAMLYDRTLAKPEFVAAVKKQLEKVRIPVLFDTGYLAPFLQRRSFSFFQEVGYTERPVTACAKICEGKIVVLVNGSPFAMVLPYFFNENFQSLDDYATKAYFASFVRVLKYGAFFMAVMLPGLFVSIAEYTPELFPPQLLYKVAAAETATPLPLFLEMVFVIVLLEIIREAGLRLPKPIGHSVSLVAALIVGDAATKAGILSTPVLIVAALTTISMFVIPSLYEPATVLRILFVLAGGLFGPFGILTLTFLMVLSICGMNSFGLPYTAPIVPFGKGALRDGILRFPWQKLAQKPFNVNDLPGGEEKYEPERTD